MIQNNSSIDSHTSDNHSDASQRPSVSSIPHSSLSHLADSPLPAAQNVNRSEEPETVSRARENARAALRHTASVLKWLDAAKILALIVLLIYLPALAIIALAVVLTSSGPAFISRCYKRPNGELVDLWEFRTECWTRWEPTLLGRCLRNSNMHRLPALVNVLLGDVQPGERVKAA